MLDEGIMEHQAPALDANWFKIMVRSDSEQVSAHETSEDSAPEVAASAGQQTVWPRVWPGL